MTSDALDEDDRPATAAVAPGTQRGARFGIWLGSFGWLLGLALVTLDHLDRLWLELCASAFVTAAVALLLERLLLRRPPPGLARIWSAVAVAVGALLSVYVGLVMPVVVALPSVHERLARLSSVVEFPIWPGLVLAALGAIGLFVTRPASR